MLELDAIKVEITGKETTKGKSTAELNATITDVKACPPHMTRAN